MGNLSITLISRKKKLELVLGSIIIINKTTTYPSLTLTTKSSGIYLSFVTSANGVLMLKLQNLGGFSISYLNFGQNVYSGC